jgi:hypothetical protein
MSIRSKLLTGAMLAASFIGTSSLEAQGRQGLFIGFGAGGGGGQVSGNTDASGESGYLMLGGTVSPRVRLAGEFNSLQVDEGSETVGTSTVSVLYYPSARGNFFVKGGLGASVVTLKVAGPDGTGVGAGVSLGAGYDLRLGRNFSITPQLTYFGGRTGDIEDDDGNPIANDVEFGMATLSIGLVFH